MLTQERGINLMTNQDQAVRPVPIVDESSKPFFDAAADAVLLLQRCDICHAYLWPLREICTECLSTDLSWAPSTGKGSVHSFVIMHRLFHPAFQEDVPYNLTVVQLDEGPRVTSIIRGTDNDNISVGMNVSANWHDVNGTPLLHFEAS